MRRLKRDNESKFRILYSKLFQYLIDEGRKEFLK